MIIARKMASRYLIEEENSLEEPMEFSSIRSSILETVRCQSQVLLTFDSEDFRDKLTEMLLTVNLALERIDQVMMCCRISYSPRDEMLHPLRVRDELIEIRSLINQGLGYLEQLFMCSNEIYRIIGHLIMYEIEIPELADFDAPYSSVVESISRVVSVASVESIVSTLTSKRCLISLINLATNHVMVMRNYRRSITELFHQSCVEVICSSVVSEYTQIRDDIDECVRKIEEFGIALDHSQVKVRLRSANSILEVAIYNNPKQGIYIIKTILSVHNQFQISFNNFCLEDYNRCRPLNEIWSDFENSSLTTGLIHPIIATLHCSPPVAWRILKLLQSKSIKNVASISYQTYERQPASITSDPGLD